MSSFQRHSTRVFFLRWFFPVLAVIALIGVVAIPAINEFRVNQLSKNSATRLRVEKIAVALPKDGAPMQLQVTKPEYSGQDDQGHPYTVTADKVIQDGMTPGASVMNLQAPKATLILDPAAQQNLNLTAATGRYDPAAKTLDLSGPVHMTHTNGYQLDMQQLSLDLIAGTAVSQQPVTGSGPNGTLAGESMELRDRGNTIILHGKSRVVLTPAETDQ